MDFGILFRAIVIGFSIAAPVGPISILCIQRTLAKGRTGGLASGFGAATADAVYGGIAGFGLTIVSNFLLAQQFWLRLVGGFFLCFIGARALLSKSNPQQNRAAGGTLTRDYFSTFLLTLTNPLTILSFVAVFVSLGGSSIGNFNYAGLFVAGIATGSAMWWLVLTSLVSAVRTKFDAKKIKIVNIASGLIIIGFGLYFLFSLL
jgi:threonine/homoserine/homoserine lactone efflux protein